jgi:hypothetical protein
VARRNVGGRETDEWCFAVFVSRKLPRDLLSASEIIPPELITREGIVRTDVEERQQPQFLADTALYRPLQGGCQIASSSGSGTLGGVVYDGTDFRLVLLTCNHVLTAPGQRSVIPADARVAQPLNGGAFVGTTKRIVPYLPAPSGGPGQLVARVDAGIVVLDPNVDAEFRIIQLGKHPYVILPPYEGLRVVKRGFATERTEAIVKVIDVSVAVDAGAGQKVRIGGPDSGFAVKTSSGNLFAQVGDSGALIIDADGGAARGMLFGGEALGPFQWCYACELNAVFQELQLETPCTGGFHVMIRRAIFRRFTQAWTEVEGHGQGLVDEMIRKSDRFRDMYLPAVDNGRVSGALGIMLRSLATDLAEQVHGDEDFAGLLDDAFGDWLVCPTMYDMLEYRLPDDFALRVSKAFERFRERCPGATGYEWLPIALTEAKSLTMREFLAREVRAEKAKSKRKAHERLGG